MLSDLPDTTFEPRHNGVDIDHIYFRAYILILLRTAGPPRFTLIANVCPTLRKTLNRQSTEQEAAKPGARFRTLFYLRTASHPYDHLR